MPEKKTVVYECNLCGTEVTVKGSDPALVSPIYCCGIETGKRAEKRGKKAEPKKVTMKTGKKAAKKKTGNRGMKAEKKSAR